MSVINNNYSDCRTSKRHKSIKIFLAIIAGIVITVIAALLFGSIVQWLWNRTITDIFAVKPISFWQSVGILILSRLLFGGFGHAHHRRQDQLHEHFGKKLRNKIRSKFCSERDLNDDIIPSDETLDQYLNENKSKLDKE